MIPEAIREVFGLHADDEQFARMQEALRNRDLHFAVQRDWGAAAAAPEDKRTEAEEKVEKRVSEWVGHEVTPEDVEKLAE